MAYTKLELEQYLPEGTFYTPWSRCYCYRAFTCDELFLMGKPRFNWPQHIEQTLRTHLAGTMDKFMKVV